jgi:plasmid maintenance system antidote protein VapI
MAAFGEILRQAVVDCGLSQNALARRSGVDVAVICRFINRKQGLSLVVIDRLVEALGIEVKVRRRKPDGSNRS